MTVPLTPCISAIAMKNALYNAKKVESKHVCKQTSKQRLPATATATATGRGIQAALTNNANGNGKKNSSNCTAPAGRGNQRALTNKHNANRERNSGSAYR
jgi:hypothetical protein